MRLRWLVLIGWIVLLTGCSDKSTPPPLVFIPPTSIPQPTATPLSIRPTPQASPTPSCTNDLRFLDDLTVPDGSVFAPGEPIDKRWQVRNSGTCNWDVRYRLRHLQGDTLGAAGDQALYPARAGAEAVIRILFTAPETPGEYFSAWQAVDPQGEPFGDPIFIQIVVEK